MVIFQVKRQGMSVGPYAGSGYFADLAGFLHSVPLRYTYLALEIDIQKRSVVKLADSGTPTPHVTFLNVKM